MDVPKITFRKAVKADKKLVHEWLDKPHIKEYWDASKKMRENFDSYLKESKPFLDFWICSLDKEPFGLIKASDATEPDHDEERELDYFIPWTELEGVTLLVDFAIGEESFLGKGLSSETLKQFAKIQEPSVTAFLADPEAKNERAVHVFEKAGFARITTFIRGKGFFKGKPHYLLKLKIMHNTSE